MLTFEHQGCRQFEGDEGHLRDAEATVAEEGTREAERLLLRKLREREGDLKASLESASDHWGFVEMAVRYARLEAPPPLLPSGYAALLCLYRLR